MTSDNESARQSASDVEAECFDAIKKALATLETFDPPYGKPGPAGERANDEDAIRYAHAAGAMRRTYTVRKDERDRRARRTWGWATAWAPYPNVPDEPVCLQGTPFEAPPRHLRFQRWTVRAPTYAEEYTRAVCVADDVRLRTAGGLVVPVPCGDLCRADTGRPSHDDCPGGTTSMHYILTLAGLGCLALGAAFLAAGLSYRGPGIGVGIFLVLLGACVATMSIHWRDGL